MATESAEAPAAKPKKKMMLIIIVAVLVLAIGGGAAFFLMGRNKHAEEGEEAVAAAEPKDKAPPTFLAIENMVVNLADPGGDRFAQVGVTLELLDKKAEEKVKAYMPSIRNSILLLISQRTSEELLQREGKEKLANDILVEVSRPLGYTVKTGEDKAGKSGKGEEGEKRPAKPSNNPVQRVLFSSFIVQ